MKYSVSLNGIVNSKTTRLVQLTGIVYITSWLGEL